MTSTIGGASFANVDIGTPPTVDTETVHITDRTHVALDVTMNLWNEYHRSLDVSVYGDGIVQVTLHGLGSFTFPDTDVARFFADLLAEAADAVDRNKESKY